MLCMNGKRNFQFNKRQFEKVWNSMWISTRYEIEHGELPTSMSQLTSGSHPYLKEKQAVCPSGLAIQINDGEAYVSK